MPALTALEAAQQIARVVNDLGGRWMLDVETLGHCRDIGYRNGFVYYVVGRGGVLGDCDADVVSAAFGFFAPSLIRTMWEGGVAIEGPRQTAQRYGQACAAFGRQRLGGFSQAERYCELATRVINAADLSGMSLFAGWKNEPRPDDAPGRAYFLTNILRELRGSAHIVAIAAAGLTPLEAVLASDAGPAHAKQFGWGDEFDDMSHLAGRREQAERSTDDLCAMPFESALAPQERGEFVQLVAALNTAMGPR